MAEDWTRDEVKAVVANYFAMLQAELSEEDYNKAEDNRGLQRRINRNRGSIEFKHQNISAVLINFHQPFIPGYLPRENYQKLLEQGVLEWLSTHPRFFQRLADGPILAPKTRPSLDAGMKVTSLIESPPERAIEVGRLQDEDGRPDLARRIEWISDTQGDGAGYDIASFNDDESPRLIEVKTTGLGKQFPFLVTANEVRVSERESHGYHLYRVFEFTKAARVYVLRGALSERCRLEAVQYRARL